MGPVSRITFQMVSSEQRLKKLMVDSLEGDADAHEALLRVLLPLLNAYFRGRLRGFSVDVDDLVQETLMAIHHRRTSYDRDKPFSAWLFSIAKYKSIDHFRRTRHHIPVDELEHLLITDGFEDESGARLDIDGLLATLPAKQARVIRDTKVNGLSVAETANAAEISESDVKVSVHRGMQTLMHRIRGYD
jgi:RNA polymerase sigma factor (sigma-70 family)